METPLLHGYTHLQNGAKEQCISIDQILAGSKPSEDSKDARAPDNATPRQDNGVDLRFVQRLGRLMVLAGAQGALLLAALSVLEVLVIAQVGVLPGLFYKALLDNDVKLFASAMWRSLLWYSSAALCAGVKLGVSEMLALQWRKRLTLAAHSRYCRDSNVFHLMKEGAVDNPDQRVAQEIQLFSTGLAQLLHKTVVAPLMIAYYTVLVWSYVGWTGPLAVYLFFSVGTLGARCLISPIAALVAKQEKLEGDFRVAHVRLRNNAEQVALYASSPVERTALNLDLNHVLTNQRSLVIRHTILELGSKAYDYSGSILNYAILALPIFVGIYGKGAEVDKGAIAQLVSNASFAILTLIYSFTQLIDAAKVLSDVAGVTGRVAGLFEALERMGGTATEAKVQPDEKCRSQKQGPQERDSLAHFLAQSVALTPSLPGLKDQGPLAQFSNPFPWTQTLPNPFAPVQEGFPNGLLLGPLTQSLGGGSLEFSVHTVPPELRGILQEVFLEQGAPGLWTQPLLVVPTFQGAKVDLWEGRISGGGKSVDRNGTGASGPSSDVLEGAGDELSVSQEMARLGDVFLSWQGAVCGALREGGFWAAAVDPRTGLAVSSRFAEAEPLRCGVKPEALVDLGDSLGVNLGNRRSNGRDGRGAGKFQEADSLGDESSFGSLSSSLGIGLSSNPALVETSAASNHPSNSARLQSSLLRSADLSPHSSNGEIVTVEDAQGSEAGLVLGLESSDQLTAAYSEVHGAEVLLGYETGTSGTCPVVFHPRFGSRTYPASLFTNAPLDVLSKAIEKARISVSDRSPPFDSPRSTHGISAELADGVSDAISAPVLEVSNLTVQTPGGVLVVRAFDLRIGVRERVMLMGPSGCGKTTLVRAIAGLWPQVEGLIRTGLPSGGSGTLFLPQTPLLARGGLAAQLSYPREVPSFTEDVESRMREALTIVELDSLLHRVDGNWTRDEDWPAILSPGEQQRLSLARVLFHRPRLAILDEATSAIGEALEARIYAQFAALDTSLLTISHRHTLKRWHSQVVHIRGDGEGTWSKDEMET
ncbi:ABC transporter D family member 4 [Klebsormidium nitens]|uniref:ABC transporter D family member 4 n=1 Tax=Klebsormidium nitens TaxID=105231 RepID=A0A1Y1II69_KLENI|nr:ABC transporter D family member 4 [Klebsormidium nitens]|eukprot:GAQ88416.1 ABC transporter D family member 4 [Klebsormidium nitens]